MYGTGFDVVRLPGPHTLERHLSELIPKLSVDCVIDVGAMHGSYAHLLRRIGYDGLILSADPVPSNVEVLRQQAADDQRWRSYLSPLGMWRAR